MQYQQSYRKSPQLQPHNEDGLVVLPPLSSSLILGDDALDCVKTAWQLITDADSDTFMTFDAREGADDDDG